MRTTRLRGARTHNLRSLDLDLDPGSLVVVAGPSGAGKSSLAFGTLYAEGQRRYVESFSAYARQFLERLARPPVDELDPVPAAIAVDRQATVRTSRSTVGTMTGTADFAKLLWARAASLHCDRCARPVGRDDPDSVAQELFAAAAGARVIVTYPLAVTGAEHFIGVREELVAAGYRRVLSGEDVTDLDALRPSEVGDGGAGTLGVVADRVMVRARDRARLVEGIEVAMRRGSGRVDVRVEGAGTFRFSAGLHCVHCDRTFREPTPGLFSFNSPVGACETCRGFGRTIGVDFDLVVPDRGKTLAGGAIRPWAGKKAARERRRLRKHAALAGVPLDVPVSELSPEQWRWLVEGEGARVSRRWQGLRGWFRWLETRAYKMHVRVFLARYRKYETCRDCSGTRLKPAALAWTLGGRTLPAFNDMSVRDALCAVRVLSPRYGHDPSVTLLLSECASRLQMLEDVGLGYLTLGRPSRTLSGGELQRVALTSALGASLAGAMFVLDEPTVGLHPRDVDRLCAVVRQLSTGDNITVVVEHAPGVICCADRVIELGPGAGEHGGKVVFDGSPAELLQADTATGRALRRRAGAGRARRRPDEWIRLSAPRGHNLRGDDAAFPVGALTCVTGVSGSGKSSLVVETLCPAVTRALGGRADTPLEHGGLSGHELISSVVRVDQAPLGRTSRGNPATYLKVWDVVRSRFAAEPLARSRGYRPGFFSFNVPGGRCEACKGEGAETVEMQFLADVTFSCPECGGRRFLGPVLDVKHRGLTIADVLDLTVTEALARFEEDVRVPGKIRPLVDVGLGYLRLGQPLNTLSGGEAQRLKLAEALSRATKGSLVVLDEPTAGLHADDVTPLLAVLDALVSRGDTVVVVEHDMRVAAHADWVIDLGPGAGLQGGAVVAAGTPEEVAGVVASASAPFLAWELGLSSPRSEMPGGGGRRAASRPPYGASDRAPSSQPVRPAAASAYEAVGDAGGVGVNGTGSGDEAGTGYEAVGDAGGVGVGPIPGAITITNAREHNLQDVSLSVPRDALVVITGPSGSGKSTLAFDIIHAEGQRRYIETLSVYARQYLPQLPRPDVDRVAGVPPSVALEQRMTRGGRSSTVATLTEVAHYLRLVWARAGLLRCPDCGVPIQPRDPEGLAAELKRRFATGALLRVFFPFIRGRKGMHRAPLARMRKAGYSQARIDGSVVPLRPGLALDRYREHEVDVLVGVVRVGDSEVGSVLQEALQQGDGAARVLAGEHALLLSSRRACPSCGQGFPELDPRFFSFNTRQGACPGCEGQGTVETSARSGRRAREVRVVCHDCAGTRLSALARAVTVDGASIDVLTAMSVRRAATAIRGIRLEGRESLVARVPLCEVERRLAFLDRVGLGYLRLDRAASTLSGGELQRVRLAAQLGAGMTGVLYVLDEPTIGLHPRDTERLLSALRELVDRGNSVIVVEHDADTIRAADHLVDVGPGGGRHGGRVVAEGPPRELLHDARSVTGKALARPAPVPPFRRSLEEARWLDLRGASQHNLRSVDLRIPLGRLVAVTGVSGSGKSTLVREVLLRATRAALGLVAETPGAFGELRGTAALRRAIEVDQSPIGRTPRSVPVTYVGVWGHLRRLLAATPEARARGYTASRFSFNVHGGRCPDCAGQGALNVEMSFLPDVRVPCDTCLGRRFNPETLDVRLHGLDAGEILQLDVSDASDVFASVPKVHRPLELLDQLGLGYLRLGQASNTLSGGEAQRLKLVSELGATSSGPTLYVMDEPTTGLHRDDVERLLDVLAELVERGDTVVVIEHHPDVILAADYVVDLGPEGGEEGGRIVAEGTPEQVARRAGSHTGAVLARELGLPGPGRTGERSRGVPFTAGAVVD